MKNLSFLPFLLFTQISWAQNPPPAIMPVRKTAPITECLFCDNKDYKIGSLNLDRTIDERSVVGKAASEGLPSTFEPSDLVDVEAKYITPLYRREYTALFIAAGKSEKMRRDAYIAMARMLDTAHASNIDLYIHSAYRSFETQCRVFTGKLVKQLSADKYISRSYTSPFSLFELMRDMKNGYKPEFTPKQLKTCIDEVNTRSALPGQSEHQLGSVADLVTMLPTYEPATPTPDKPQFSGYAVEYEMQDTPAFKWLQENAYKFGYALSYPNSEMKDFTKPNTRTGYIYEPWHWRYIGVDHARRFKDCNKLVLREFLHQVAKNPQFQCITTLSSAIKTAFFPARLSLPFEKYLGH